MLNLLFLIKDHQDLDHFSPLIVVLKNKYKIYIRLENTEIENDKRFKTISSVAEVLHPKNQSKMIKKLKLLLLKFNFIIKVLNFLQKKIKINNFFKTILKSNFLIKKKIAIIFYDHRPAHECPDIIKAKLLGISVVSIPHGYNIFTTKIDFLETQKDRNIYDNYIVQTNFQKKILVQLGIEENKLIAIGCPRFNKDWIEKLDQIYKEKNFFDSSKPVISIFLGHWKYYIDKNRTLGFLENIIHLNIFNIFLNLHTRGTSPLDKAFLNKVKNRSNCIINNGQIFSSITISQSDLIVGLGTSVLLEAISRKKVLIYLPFLQNVKTVFNNLDQNHIAQSEEDFFKKISKHLKNRNTISYDDFYKKFIKDDIQILENLIQSKKDGNYS